MSKLGHLMDFLQSTQNIHDFSEIYDKIQNFMLKILKIIVKLLIIEYLLVYLITISKNTIIDLFLVHFVEFLLFLGQKIWKI